MKKRRIMMSLAGVLICAVSVGVFKIAALGVDPFQSLMSGLDAFIPIPFGTLYVIVNALLLIFSASVVTITARYAVNAFTYGFADSAVLYLYHGLSKIVLTFTAAVPLYFLNRLILGGGR